MEAVQQLCGLDSDTRSVAVVGMPARLAYVIQEAAKIVADDAITNFNISSLRREAIKTEINDFLQLFRNRWKYIIASNAEKLQKKMRSIKPKSMPDDDDIKIVATEIKRS